MFRTLQSRPFCNNRTSYPPLKEYLFIDAVSQKDTVELVIRIKKKIQPYNIELHEEKYDRRPKNLSPCNLVSFIYNWNELKWLLTSLIWTERDLGGTVVVHVRVDPIKTCKYRVTKIASFLDHVVNGEGCINKKLNLNLFIIGFAFFCNFTAYTFLQNLQSTIHKDKKIGLASLSVIHASLMLSCFFLPPLLIKNLGCKYTIALSSLGFIPYTVAHFYPTWWIFMTASVILGTFAAPLWSAKASYITKIAMHYASVTNENPSVLTTKFFGISLTMFQLSQISGNLFSSLLLKTESGNFTFKNKYNVFCRLLILQAFLSLCCIYFLVFNLSKF
ncbi:UNC93-like protein [Hydractinia symbiolongicarpus]|uniref:UNC93-like protein n=1 Tax=Hydractinia symbiolongicarpus TaxID=13093 RepID=UPI00254ACDBA|nr:UNC93-like protein [Hydractinia symbiolongicarpus]